MINVEVLTNFNRNFKDPNYPFLRKQVEEYKRTKPLKGVRILHNLINSFETLLKIETLMHSGADLTLTRCHFAAFPHQAEVDAVLFATGIPYVPNHSDLEGEFDIGMDCAADLLRLPRVKLLRGAVELTRVGAIAYEKANTPYPVISVDDSNLKKLECMLGTGESFIRAFKELTGETFIGRKVVLFGFGKIGKGIARYLSQCTDQISIVEASYASLREAQQQGLRALSLKDNIRAEVRDAFAIVTATGVNKMLSRYLSAADVGTAYIANMGVDDEIGDAFGDCKVLFNRAPINFSLKHPTLMKYFDPICYAHNLAAELLVTRSFAPGFHRFPASEDNAIVSEWESLYGDKVPCFSH
jgi:adenosylhomocysteinase